MELFARSIPNQYRYKKEWMDNNKSDVETLVLGNSHAFKGIKTSMIHNAFNLAQSAQRLEYDYYLLSKYISESPNLKNVVLSLDYSNLFAGELESEYGMNWNLAIYYNLYMDYPKHGTFSKYHYELSCPKSMYKKVLLYLTSLVKNGSYEIGCDATGYGDSSESMKNKKQSDMDDKPISLRLTRNYDISTTLSVNVRYLEDIVKICKQHHVRIILISTPYWHNFYKKTENRKIQLLDNVIKKLIDKYDIEYKNYMNASKFSYNNDFFYNGDHLSPEGAEAFTTVLIRDCGLN